MARLYQNFLGGTLTYDLPDTATVVTDGATTDTDTTVTSATAAFTAADVGVAISGAGIPAGATIASVTSATEAELSAAATATATGVTFTIDRHLLLHSISLGDAPTVVDGDELIITLDPDGTAGDPEAVRITEHGTGTTYAYVERGAEGSTARDHLATVEWVHAAMASDLIGVQATVQTGTSYTLRAADAGNVVEMDNAASITVTVPTNAAVPFPIGTIVEVYQAGVGSVAIVGDTGVTVRNDGTIAAQYGTASLRKRGTDEWVATGALL